MEDDNTDRKLSQNQINEIKLNEENTRDKPLDFKIELFFHFCFFSLGVLNNLG